MTGREGKIGGGIGANQLFVVGTSSQSGAPAPTAPQYNQDTPTTLGRGISKELSHTTKHVPYSSVSPSFPLNMHSYASLIQVQMLKHAFYLIAKMTQERFSIPLLSLYSGQGTKRARSQDDANDPKKPRRKKRSRCGKCIGCQEKEDCGICINCK